VASSLRVASHQRILVPAQTSELRSVFVTDRRPANTTFRSGSFCSNHDATVEPSLDSAEEKFERLP
jgi:hypothetical protein